MTQNMTSFICRAIDFNCHNYFNPFDYGTFFNLKNVLQAFVLNENSMKKRHFYMFKAIIPSLWYCTVGG